MNFIPSSSSFLMIFSLTVLWMLLFFSPVFSFHIKGSSRLHAKPQSSYSHLSTLELQHEHLKSRRKPYITPPTMILDKIKPAPKIIIAGAPAAGKGTQCEVIKSNFGVIHLSTGDILRAAVKEGTELGLKAKAFMDAGQLVPDELIIGVICDRLKQKDCLINGWLLDGFPRTRAQAEALALAGLVPDSFILLDVPVDLLVERVTGRRTDPVTGKIYHMKFSPPPPQEKEVIARLIQRSDDTAEKIIVRYQEFQSHIDSIKSFYETKTTRIDGSIDKDEVSKQVISALTKDLSIVKTM